MNQLGGAEPPQFQPRGAQKQSKLAQIGQNGGLKVPVVPNGWNSVERSWNGLWEVQVKVFEPISKVPVVSNELSNRHFGQSGPIWAVFGHPWAEIGVVPLLPIGSKTLAWTSQSPFQLRSTLFQPFGTTGTFKPPFWPIWAVFGQFLGPGGPKFQKYWVREVERGSGHLES